MKIHNVDYPDYKTIRQWALSGFLPKEKAEGIELWSNGNCKHKYIYYSPEEVVAATEEQLTEFFRPEKDRRNEKEKIRRRKERAEQLERMERERKEEQQEMIYNAVKPYIERILELQKIIRTIPAASNPCPKDKTIVIDTETTGLNKQKDELLQVSIIDNKANVLFDSYFKPFVKSWKEAERINNITPEMVQNAPTFSEKVAEINEIISHAKTIIGYNIEFDVEFLKNNGIIVPKETVIDDVMQSFAIEYGEWNDYYCSYKWQKLKIAAEYYGYDWNSRPESAHNSLADCYATLYVYNKMKEKKESDEVC